MANISKDTFDPTKLYRKVIFQQQGALMDFDVNEAQDIITYERDLLLKQLAEGANLLGTGGRVTPSATARAVDITGGIGVSADGTGRPVLIRIPTVAALAAFDGAASGVQTATVYVEWWDSEVDSVADPNIKDASFGESTRRTKRNVSVLVVGGLVLPAPAAGHVQFTLATVTHDFGTGSVLQTADITHASAGVTPGELSGKGAARTLRLTSGAAAGLDGFVLDTVNAPGAGAAFRLRIQGADKLIIDSAGRLGVLGAPSGTNALTVNGDESVTGALNVGGNIIVGGTVDGIDVSSHVHDGTATGGGKVTHANLLGLAADDHAQYVHISTARTVSARHTFNPGAASSPFILGANAQGQLVAGLNADQLDGLDSTAFARLGIAQNVTGQWTFKANQLADPGVTFDGVDLSTIADGAGKISHSLLSGLGNDDHTQYLHLTTARTISARHTFNPAAASSPFILGANAAGQLVSGLNAEQLGGQTLANLDARYVKADGTVPMTGNLTLSGTALRFTDANVSISRAGNVLTLSATGGHSLVGAVTLSSTLAVTGTSTLTGRSKFAGNLLDVSGIQQAISVPATIPVANVGTRALITKIDIDPGTYAGAYDVAVYADNNTTSELLAQWLVQTGHMTDKVPWYFVNARGDEQLFVRITKATGTGTNDTFTIALRAERFA